jgi:FKBP-type peptidyl-prolyl cis-trans isomerase
MTVEELTNPPVDTNTTADEFVSITPDGQLKKRILRQGSGASPVAGSKVRVHYVGTLHPSGEKFDSSRDRNDMFEFNLGKGQVIRGWDEGVATMKVGELAELLCPPEYGKLPTFLQYFNSRNTKW